MTWYCGDCGSPQVYDVISTTDEQGRFGLGFCGSAADEEKHGCSFKGDHMDRVPMIQFQRARTRRKRVRPEVVEAFPDLPVQKKSSSKREQVAW